MAPLSLLMAAVLTAAPAAAQVKAVPEVAAPVGGGVTGAQSGRAMPGASGLSAPSLAAPSLALPSIPAAALPSVQARAGAAALAAPAAALALPAPAAPASPARKAASAAPKPVPAAPAKGLEGLREKTAEMGELLGKEGGGAQAGVQAAGVASSIFDGGLGHAGLDAAAVDAGGSGAGGAHRLSASLLLRAGSADGAGGMPVLDTLSSEVLATVRPTARVSALVETERTGPRGVTMAARDLLAASLDPEAVSVRVTGVEESGALAPIQHAVVTFKSGEVARGAGSPGMLRQLAALEGVASVEIREGPPSMRRVSEVPPEERGAGYDRVAALAATLGSGIMSSSLDAGLAGMKVHHGTLSAFESSVRAGPKNLGKGFGGRGLYVAVAGERPLAEFFAAKAARESRTHLAQNAAVPASPGPAAALVMDGTVNPDRPLKVGRFEVRREAPSADLARGILPAGWDEDPNLRALLERRFDVLDLRGLRSSGLAIDTDRLLVFHESAGADAIRWQGGAAEAAEKQGPGAAARAYGRFNVLLGRAFYAATAGSFGILPRTFGTSSDGAPLIILERKTAPFSQILPRALRPRHYLSIGVNAAPDLASKKALIKAFAELGSPEALKRLGIGEPGGPLGFKVVTENPALVAFAKRFEKDGWKVLPYAQDARALDKAQHWLQHPYASLRRLAEAALGMSRPDPRHIILRDFSAAPPVRAAEPPAASRAPPETLRQAFTPLAAGEVIVDANIAIALEHQAHGDLVRPEHKAFVRRIGGRTARQPERAFAETRWGEPNAVVPIRTERRSPEYRALLGVLDEAVVGRAKGASDREIVADAFFAVTADGAPAAFYTGDKGIYNALARIAGHEPAKLGKSVPDAFPDGFSVSIAGRTLLVVPVASR
ncbi:MAG: hypothetical protein HY928_09170 [Elusimicrobia bacterium]|nr:hypothetical protein [Elusimicrobiota bacterium]